MLVPYVFGLIYCGLLINFPKLTEAGIPKSLAFFVQSSLILFSSDSRTSSQSIVKFFNLAFDWIVIIDYRHKCILNLNPIKRLTYNYYEPLAPLLSIFTWYIIFKLYYLVVHRSGIPSKWNWRIIGSLIWVFLWCYILLAKASFSLINCTTIGDAYVLSAAPNVICYSPEHIPYMIGAWFVIVAYIIGFPFLCGGLLWYAKKKIATNPGYPLCKELYRTYQPTFWFYEIVLIFRKLILTLLDVFLLKYPVEHNLMLSIFFYVIFFIQYWMQPFKNKMFNLAEDFVLMTLILLGGFSLSDTMRVYYLSTIDINLVGLVFTSVCFLSILCLIFFMSTTGNLLMDKLVSMSPFLARIVHSIRQRSEKVHQWGSAFSMDEKKQGSTNTVDGRKSNLSNDATKNSSNNLKKSQASNMEHSAPIRSFPMIEESSKKPSNLALT
ncbi:hypothetical protein HMI56_003202 [Coelomomyces lativittatus]|nr:hypothetical protein HMI56_003202 [Coelomomyces lativittatus]